MCGARPESHRKLLIVVTITLSFAAVPIPTMAATNGDEPGATAAEVVALANQARTKFGCSSLTVNARLMAAAFQHSKDMAAHSNMSHTGSDGSDPATRATRAGYSWIAYGENVAHGYPAPQQVMNAWMNSPGHRKNVLDCSFKEIGVGLAQPGNYWTQTFGTSH